MHVRGSTVGLVLLSSPDKRRGDCAYSILTVAMPNSNINSITLNTPYQYHKIPWIKMNRDVIASLV